MADPGPRPPKVASLDILEVLDIREPPGDTPLPGPLRQLRLASILPETPSSGHTKRTKTKKTTQKHTARKQIRARHALHDPGFAFSVDFPASTRQLSGNNGSQPEHVIDHLQMATVFLSLAKAAKAKYHVVDAVHAKDPVLTLQNGVSMHITPAIRRRADFVKSTIALKYAWLQRVAEPENSDSGTHPGMDPGYNPLQVLRNRVIRRKLGLQLPPQPQTPLPCDAFSTHASANGKPWKMLWGIDLQEFVADLAWRKVYWTELRNAKGELWYPEMHTTSQPSPPPPPQKTQKSRKLHDRLWHELDRGQDSRLELPRSLDSARTPKTNWKERAKRLYGALSLSAVDLRALGNFTHVLLKSFDGLASMKNASTGYNLSQDMTDTNHMYQFQLGNSGDLHQVLDTEMHKPDHGNLPPPQIVIGDHPRISPDPVVDEPADHVSDVYFSSVHLKQPLVSHLEHSSPFALSSDTVEAGPPEKTEANIQQLHLVAQKLQYLHAISTLEHNFLTSVYPQLLESTSTTLDALVQGEMRYVLRSINHINSVLLPARENLYKGFIEEAKSITHLANDTCAVKIDNLLSATDRSYGELNTSLIMDLRKTNEKLDKLNRSLFSGVISNKATIDESNTLYELADHKFLYIALENVIVVFLRLVWIGVNIVKPVFVFIKFAWRLLTLMFT